jgi:hypothetical protein
MQLASIVGIARTLHPKQENHGEDGAMHILSLTDKK